jgi:hypothetical protein
MIGPAMLRTTDPCLAPRPIRARPGVMERAFELARSGDCATIREIERRLQSEDYEAVWDHLGGPFTRAQLRGAIAGAENGLVACC